MTDVQETEEGQGSRAVTPDITVVAPWVDRTTGSRAVAELSISAQPLPGGNTTEGEAIELQPAAVNMGAGVEALLSGNVVLARELNAALRDPDFGTVLPEASEVDLEQIQTTVREILDQIGKRPSDKNALIRWGSNFWQVAKTTGLISLLGFGLRTGIQSGTTQSLNLGQPDENTGRAEGIYYGGQALSTLMMLASAASNAKDGNRDAVIGDLIYAVSMIGAAGFAKGYDVAGSLVTSTAGAAFYAGFTEILKTFRTMKVPQLAGVDPTGWRKAGAYAAGATAFTLSFIPATAWSYSKDFTGGGGFLDLDPGDRVRKGAMIGLLWAGALVGYNILTPPLVKLAVGNESGPIAPLEYDAAWKSNKELLKKSPKELLQSAIAVANDANKFFAFVLVFNTFLALNGGTRLGPAGEDAIPDEGLRIFANTVVSSVFCQLLCHIYEMQYGAKKKPRPSEVLADGSPGHLRVEAVLTAFRAELDTAARPIPVNDLADMIGRHAATLQTEAERALFTVLVYTQAVPEGIEQHRISTPEPSPTPSERAPSERAASEPPEDDAPEAAEEERVATPPQPERVATPPKDAAPAPEEDETQGRTPTSGAA